MQTSPIHKTHKGKGHRMSAFSFREGMSKVQWSRTKGLNMMRVFSAVIVWGIVMLAISLGPVNGKDVAAGNDADSSARGGGPADGDGVVAGRVSFMFDGNQHSGTTCIANSFLGENSTSITSGADAGEWTLMLEIPGTGAGAFDENAGATCSFIKPPFSVYDSETVSITVSTYGEVGGSVEGTFSGVLVNQLDSTRKSITDGTFTALRHLDVE